MESLKVALDMMLFIEDRSLKIGFNSLCAFASVNHLHYHLLFEHRTLRVQLAKSKLLKGSLYILEDYMIPTFCFDVDQNSGKAAENIYKLLECLLQKSIAHNILMAWGKGNKEENVRVFLWPRKNCSGAKNLAAFNVAVCELAGWFPVYDAVEFANIQREDLEAELNKWKYEEFDELCNEVKLLF